MGRKRRERGKEERKCAFAGDFRVNEQPGLSTMHTIWMREHNRIAGHLTELNRHWDPEIVFQETRRLVVAEWQMIVYNEWLPIVLGQEYMKRFSLKPLQPGQGYTVDYDPGIDPRVNVEFSGAAFRFGHSMVPGLMKINGPGQSPHTMRLKDVFNDPSKLREEGFLEGVILGQSLDPAPAWDPQFSEDLVNHLFEEEGSQGGKDLASLNIQRGRDLGIHGYNKYREICASKSGKYGPVSSWDQLTTGGHLSEFSKNKLENLYRDVEDIDLFVAGVLEESYKEALLGPAFLCIIGDQFSRFKRGDRFWFENGLDPETRFSMEQLDSIRDVSMARILCDNTEIESVQPFVFRTHWGINQQLNCNNSQIPSIDLTLWKE